MKRSFTTLSYSLMTLLLATCVFMTACDEDDDKVPANEVRYQNLVLNGQKEVPSNPSTNTGTFNGVYNKDTNVMSYTITWTGFTATNMHFHKAPTTNATGATVSPTTTSGGVALAISSAPFNSPLTGTVTLTDAQETDLLAGVWYVNIHSSQYGGGEIRAQIVP